MQKFSVAAVFVVEAEDLKAATTKLKDELGQVVGDMVFDSSAPACPL